MSRKHSFSIAPSHSQKSLLQSLGDFHPSQYESTYTGQPITYTKFRPTINQQRIYLSGDLWIFSNSFIKSNCAKPQVNKSSKNKTDKSQFFLFLKSWSHLSKVILIHKPEPLTQCLLFKKTHPLPEKKKKLQPFNDPINNGTFRPKAQST